MAQQDMCRGAAIVDGNIAYFRPAITLVLSIHISVFLGKRQWSQLPANESYRSGLAVVDGLPTSVGGYSNGSYINSSASRRVREGSGVRYSLLCPPKFCSMYHYLACSSCGRWLCR